MFLRDFSVKIAIFHNFLSNRDRSQLILCRIGLLERLNLIRITYLNCSWNNSLILITGHPFFEKMLEINSKMPNFVYFALVIYKSTEYIAF